MILTDRTTGDKYELKVTDGEYYWSATESAADSDPIVEDALNSGTHWKLFIDDGQFAWEQTATVQDDTVRATDTETGMIWEFEIYDGQLRYTSVGASGTNHYSAISVSDFLSQTITESDFLSQTIEVGL